MIKIFGKLRCPVCSKVVSLEEKVILNNINTITHQECYYQSTDINFPSKIKVPSRKFS